MTKQAGMGDNLFVGAVNLSGDIGSLGTIATPRAPLDVTGIDKSAHERLGGLRDGSIEFQSWFNPAAGQAHEVLSALPTTDVIVTYWRGTTLGNQAASIVAKQIGYDPTRGADGSLSLATAAQANGFGLEWGVNLGHLIQASAGAGTGVDSGAATAFGLQAYLHLLSFTGTSITVAIQESANDGSPDVYTNVVGGVFDVATGPTSQRIATARDLAVERWLRINTTGTFSAATFAVSVARNPIEVNF